MLIISGVWIEGMYQATQVVKQKPNEEIIERIGLQKIILEHLLLILEYYDRDPKFAKLYEDFKEINDVYKELKIVIKIGEPIVKDIGGVLVIEQTEESNVEISKEQLDNIINIIEKKRNKLTSLK